jgi:hypothetical protein
VDGDVVRLLVRQRRHTRPGRRIHPRRGLLPQAPSSKAAANASMAGTRVTVDFRLKIGMKAINISAGSYKYNSKQALGRPAVTSS